MRSKHDVLLSALLALLVLGGCRVDTVLTVESAEDGSGTVSVSVTLDQEASALDGDLDAMLQGARSAGTGWDISVRRTVDGTTIVAEKEFASPGEAEAIVTELSGASGPLGAFRFEVDAGVFMIESRVSGRLDLQERQMGSDRARQRRARRCTRGSSQGVAAMSPGCQSDPLTARLYGETATPSESAPTNFGAPFS